MITRDWIEEKTDQMIRRARRSQYAREIFADAKHIHETEALVMDVALMISLRYWCGDLITGHVWGVDP